MPLAAKLQIAPNLQYWDSQYSDMATSVLEGECSLVLIAWQHQDILPYQAPFKDPASGSIVYQLLTQTNTSPNELSNPLPVGTWPGERFDMVFVFSRTNTAGPFTQFTQVPQMLLAGDSSQTFPT